MSDHTVVLTVVLDEDYRVDDVQYIIDAIKMIRGVGSVEANVANIETYTAYARARLDLEQRIWAALKESNKEES
jgi:hypothetical protein